MALNKSDNNSDNQFCFPTKTNGGMNDSVQSCWRYYYKTKLSENRNAYGEKQRLKEEEKSKSRVVVLYVQ